MKSYGLPGLTRRTANTVPPAQDHRSRIELLLGEGARQASRSLNKPLVLNPVPIQGRYYAVTALGIRCVDLAVVNRVSSAPVTLPPPTCDVWNGQGEQCSPDDVVGEISRHYNIAADVALGRITATVETFKRGYSRRTQSNDRQR